MRRLVMCSDLATFDRWLAESGAVRQEHVPAWRWSHMLGKAQIEKVVFLPGWDKGRSRREQTLILDEAREIEARWKDPTTHERHAQQHHGEPTRPVR